MQTVSDLPVARHFSAIFALMVFAWHSLGQGPDLPQRSAASQMTASLAGRRAGDAEQKLRDLETQWATAVGANDPVRIGKFFPGNFLFVGARGVLQDRAQHLDDFKSGRLHVESVAIKEVFVQVYGDFAVVSTLASVRGRFAGRDISGDYRFTDTWRQLGQEWQAVARQQTRVDQPTEANAAQPASGVQQPSNGLARRLLAASSAELGRQAAVLRLPIDAPRAELSRGSPAAASEATLTAPQRLSLSRAATAPFRNPPVLDAASGTVVLEAVYADNFIGADRVHLRSYNRRLVGPTLKVKAGQALKVRLINHLPREPVGSPHATNGHHEWNTTNLHTHGLHVKPEANPGGPPASVESDNVLLELAPGATQEYSFEIPADHPAGTFWYHAHKHGATSAQVASGMAGALIVTRDDAKTNLDAVPEIRLAMETVDGREREKVMVFQQIPYIKRPSADSVGAIELPNAGLMFGPGTWNDSSHYTTINGQQIPVIEFAPGEVQRWRMIDSGFREGLTLQLIKDPDDAGAGPDHIDFHEIATDGLAGGSGRGRSFIDMFPGYRSDVLVQAPGVPGVYHLVDARREDNTLLGLDEPLKFVAKVVILNVPAVTMSGPTDAQVLAHRLPSLPAPDAATPVQEAYYGLSRGFAIGSLDPGPNGAVAGSQYDPAASRSLPFGVVQRWRIGTRNDFNFVGEAPPPPPRGPAHPFHIHVNPFEIVSIRDFAGVEQLRPGERLWRDTVSMPPGYTIEFLTRYADFHGSFVQHCHILDHEDRGMMQKVTISPPRPTAAAPRPARARTSTTIPEPGGRPSVLFFVQGSFCPHCMAQLDVMAERFAGRDFGVTVVTATTAEDLNKFPAVPFTLVADPAARWFKEYGAFDGKPRHATVVRDGLGKTLLKKVGDDPFLDADAILAAANRSALRYVIAVNRTDGTDDDYLSWSSSPCTIRVENGAPGGLDLTVTLTNDDPSANPDGGDVGFAKTLAAGTTASQPTLALQLRQDGTPVEFFMAGSKASRLTPASLAVGGRDAVVEVHEGGAAGRVVATTAVMVRVRKNFGDLSETEKTEFLKALAATRDMASAANDRFEPLVRMHKLAAMGRRPGFDQAHISSGFLPWHRAFLLLFEREMQKTHPHVALPYWLMDQPPTHFAPEYLGNNYDPATGDTRTEVILAPSNPLYGWRVRFDGMGPLVRAEGDHRRISINAGYRSGAALNGAAGGVYHSFRRLLEEDPHNVGHDNSGGWMRSCVTSPGDPLFWIFHCHHDHLWAAWQREFNRFDTSGASPNDYSPQLAYNRFDPLAERQRFPLGHHLPDRMWPWDETTGQQFGGDPYSTRPAERLSKFPASPSHWPAAPASPTAGDMIDYLGLSAGRLAHGVAYADVAFGSRTGSSDAGAGSSPALVLPERVFLDRGASEGNRLQAARTMAAADDRPSADALTHVVKDDGTSPAVRLQALRLLGRTAPADAVDRAVEAAGARDADASFADAAAAELVRLHHFGELPEQSRATIHAALRRFAGGEGHPRAAAVAMEGLVAARDPVAGPLLAAHLRAPEAAALPLRRLVSLTYGFQETRTLVRPLLAAKQDDVAVAALYALSGDLESLARRTALVTAKDVAPAVRRAAVRSVMADSREPLDALLAAATDQGELELTRAEAIGGVRVLFQHHGREIPEDRKSAVFSALSAMRNAPESELGKTLELTLQEIRRAKK